MIVLTDILPVLAHFAIAFTAPTFCRVQTLVAAAILTPGRHTIANLLRNLGPLASAHPSTFQRVLSSARWSGMRLACLLTQLIVQRFCPDGTVVLLGDDTVDGHRGKCVHGKGRHRDPVRSSHTHTVWRYGHEWIVLCILVRLPFAERPRALPILVDLYTDPPTDLALGRRHLTPIRKMIRLLRILRRRLPERAPTFVGDGGFSSHEMARFCAAHRIALVGLAAGDTALYEPPGAYGGRGRPRVKGAKLPGPAAAVAESVARRTTVDWYGAGRREVDPVEGTGCWYRQGHGIVEIRWVHVRDATGTHRDTYVYTTEMSPSAEAIVGHYTSRWNIETTFQEMRSYMGLETTQGWCAKTVGRAAPCPFGLYSLVVLAYAELPERVRKAGEGVEWVGKCTTTFSDCIRTMRQYIWREGLLKRLDPQGLMDQLPADLREFLLDGLTPAT